MVSKWDKADFGSAQIETNLNAKDGIVTINDTETVATVKQVGEAAGQLNTKFEGKLETVNSAIDSLGVRIDNAKEQLNASIESVKSYADEQLATKQPVGDYPEFQKFSAGVDPAERKTIQLANADSISGVTTDGRGVNVAMVSKWNKVDLGSSQVSMNLNSLDGQVTINDGKVVATLDDISGSETATNALIDKKIADYHKESDAKFVSAKTTGQHSTVAVSTADDEVRLSSSETNPTGSQGGVYVGSQLIQVMTNYKPSDRKEASLLMITPSRFDLKRRDAEGQMHEIELVDLITKANKVPGVEAGVEAVKNRVETLSGEVNTKTPLESFEAFKTETNGEIQNVKSNVLQLSNSVYTKSEIDGKLAGAVASVYRYKGSVATEDELPKEQNVVGDVWNVDADGANVAWDGEKWDKLGGPTDLSDYATIESVDGKVAQAKSELQPKIDANKDEIVRVEGKVDSHDAVFTKYQQTVDGKFAQEVVDRDAAIKVETDARVAAITQEVKDREAAIEGEKTAREAAVADVAGKLTTHEQAFEAFKTANTEAITAECAKVTAAFQAADEAEKAAREQAVQKVAGDLTTHSEANTAEFAKVRGEFAAADTQLQEQLNVKIDAKLAAADFDSFKTGQYKTDVDALKQADVDEAQARQTLDTKFETFKTETYEPKVAELTKSIGDETSARQDAIIETNNAFKAADEKVTGEYTKAIEAAKTEVTTKVTEVEGALNAYKGSNDAAVAKVKTDVTEAFGAADQALETKVTQGYTAAVEGEKAAREAAVALLATKVELEGVNATLTGKFGDYYTKGEVDGKLASIYRFKGSVAAEDQLPTQDQVIGDVYNVEDTGMNVAWDGKNWDKLGSVINLTPYATTESVEAKITETKQAASEALNQHAQSAETTYAKKAEVTKQIEAVDGKFAGYTTTEALNGLLDGKAAVVHTHTVDNVTGLQAALDAKMAASEAAKFATHDHNHDQAYLAIKGKAESAKVADSVAWANVTGTEAIAVKSEVEAVNAKFASYTTTEALAAEYATKQALDDGLKAKAEAVHTHVAADITDLQDKLDAKLDVGGKAESAKVADSVAWTSVTGTEGVALKSDLDSKMEASEASKFAQASHVHAIENVTGLQQALNDKIAVADADGKYALKSAITGLATKDELNGKADASHTHQEGEVEGLTARLATFALKSEIAGFVTDEALKRDYTNTADLGQLLDSKLDTTDGDKKYATKTELNGYQPKGDYVAKTEVNSIVEAAVKAPVFVNIPLSPESNYTEDAIANWFGCETIEQVGQVITGDKVVYLHFTSTGKDYKIPVQYCAFKADGSNDIILMTVGLDTANDEVCKYKITIALNSDSSTVDVNKTPLVSPAA